MNQECLHILIVEDDAVFGGVLKRSLEKRGHSVVLLTNSSDVETILHPNKQHASCTLFSHAILDLKLSNDETALSLIPPLLAAIPALKILILTGYASIHTAVLAMKMGAVNYLCKPADTDTILRALQHTDLSQEHNIPQQAMSIGHLEWEHIQKVLTDHKNNVSAAARALGMHRRTLQRKLQKKPSGRI